MSFLQAESLFSVTGKVVLVSGGSRGIGKMIASAFVRNGATVYISARSVKDCDASAAQLSTLGPGTCISIPADISKLSEVERLVQELEAREHALHVLVNNAGTVWAQSLDEYPVGSIAIHLDLKLTCIAGRRLLKNPYFKSAKNLYFNTETLPLLRAGAAHRGQSGGVFNDPSRVINIGSVEGLGVPDHDTYAYSAAKAGLHHLSRHLAGRLGKEGILSNTIACGAFRSKLTAEMLDTEGDIFISRIPTNRLGTPEDIGGAALFLASRAGAYVNGATITLDGGFLVNMPSCKL
ncbi:NAD-P-binding protein [Imleria badia]|nr:NAD-P-binding protein [Imleria badia]